MPRESSSGQVSGWGRDLVAPPSPIKATGGWLAASCSTAAALMQENGVLNGSVVYLPAGVLQEIALRITVAGSAGAVVRLGVYAIDGYQGSLVWDAGTIDGTSATTQTITGGTATILAGWYALVGAVQGNPATRPTANRDSGVGSFTWTSQSTADGQIGFPAQPSVYAFSITGALPATVTFSADGRIGTRVAVKGLWT